MDTEKIYIRKLAKVFSEGVDKHWWFNIEKYLRLASKYGLDAKSLSGAIECAEEDDTKHISPKTIGRVLGYFNGEKEGNGNKSVTLDTAKALGKALCDGDEYGLLIKIEPTNVLKIMREAEELWGTGSLNYIYRMLNNLLYELEPSSHYSYQPGSEEDGYSYYDMKLQSIRNEIDSRFWNQNRTREKLYRLVDEVEYLIKSYSIPGAATRWLDINPKLKYFDGVFDVKEEDPETYERIKQGLVELENGIKISFCFYPTKEECEARRKYFEKLNNKNMMQNNQYSYSRLYQNEVVETFRMVFEKDFEKDFL